MVPELLSRPDPMNGGRTMTTETLLANDSPATSARTPFERRLRQIRVSEEERKDRVRLERVTTQRAHAERILLAHEHVESIKRAAAGYVNDLGRVLSLPLRLSRRLFDGRYALAVHLNEGAADPFRGSRGRYSRILFLVQPLPEAGRVRLECRITVHDRDLEPTAIEDELSADGLSRMRSCMERQFLTFAESYCASREPARQPPTAPRRSRGRRLRGPAEHHGRDCGARTTP
jgi:hypothetical protein